MPTVLRIRGYRVFFYSSDIREPPHAHVEPGDGQAKFWLQPVILARSIRLSASQVRQAEHIVREYAVEIEEAWDEHFNH